MTVVADSSPLVILTKLGCLDLLNRIFPRLYISVEVHYEVVIAGADLPGASEVSNEQLKAAGSTTKLLGRSAKWLNKLTRDRRLKHG